MNRRAMGGTALFVFTALGCAAGCNAMYVDPSRHPVDASRYDAGTRDTTPAFDATTTRVDSGVIFNADGAPPDLGPVVQADPPPPPISGGTLILLRDGVTAVASDPDRDTVWFVDLAHAMLSAQVTLNAGDEPGRLTEDASGRVHVALRRGGAVVTIDTTSHAITERRPVCSAPRGIAFDAAHSAIYVACVGGEFITLPASGGAPIATRQLDDDLRDVVIDSGHIYVSRFRSAQLLSIAADGTVSRSTPGPIPLPVMAVDGGIPMAEADVAWRTIAVPTGGVLMVHQRASDALIGTGPGAYAASGCPGNGIVTAAATVFQGSVPTASGGLGGMVLPLDVAIDGNGNVAVLTPGDARRDGPLSPTLSVAPITMVTSRSFCDPPRSGSTVVNGQATSVVFDPAGHAVVFTREPASIQVIDWHMNTATTISLPGASREDTGHRLFHLNAGAGAIACASCHPEGGDDGRTWNFDPLGPRRTQALRGGVMQRAPFHWSGDQADFPTLAHTVFTNRMGGGELTPDQLTTLSHWLDAQPQLPTDAPNDAAAVDRGRALFESPALACTSCHSGADMTNHQLLDVGTGGAFKVPSLLGVRWRPPYLHNGCAATLTDRFGDCGGAMHGMTSGLTPAQLSDVVAYLQSL